MLKEAGRTTETMFLKAFSGLQPPRDYSRRRIKLYLMKSELEKNVIRSDKRLYQIETLLNVSDIG